MIERRPDHQFGEATLEWKTPLSEQFVLITGCSGGGKSTLLKELSTRGHHAVEESGRRIVRQELEAGGDALPWVDRLAFTHRAIEMALADREAAQTHSGWVFFDRGLIDAASALEDITGQQVLETLGALHRYHRCVFMAPLWPEIYQTDEERRHRFEACLIKARVHCVIQGEQVEACQYPAFDKSAPGRA